MKKSGQNSTYKKIVIVTIAISLLVLFFLLCLPRINSDPIPARRILQKAQLISIQVAIELFNNENDGDPPSGALDGVGQPYSGAMKLCEALMGWDLFGFHPDSVFRADGMDAAGVKDIYLSTADNLKARIGPLLQLENANAYRLADIYGTGQTAPFQENIFVLCDVYTHEMQTGIKIGMPILYYKADISKTAHDVNEPNNPENIYNYKDNHALLSLGVPGKPNKKHPLFTNPKIFYEMTKNWTVTPRNTTNRGDSFILISAGKDKLYGTPDDILNFNR